MSSSNSILYNLGGSILVFEDGEDKQLGRGFLIVEDTYLGGVTAWKNGAKLDLKKVLKGCSIGILDHHVQIYGTSDDGTIYTVCVHNNEIYDVSNIHHEVKNRLCVTKIQFENILGGYDFQAIIAQCKEGQRLEFVQSAKDAVQILHMVDAITKEAGHGSRKKVGALIQGFFEKYPKALERASYS